MHKTVALSNLIENKSPLIKIDCPTKGENFKIFIGKWLWMFSVEPREVNKVIDYILNQKEHHRTKVFKEEFLFIFEKLRTEIEFEKYIY